MAHRDARSINIEKGWGRGGHGYFLRPLFWHGVLVAQPVAWRKVLARLLCLTDKTRNETAKETTTIRRPFKAAAPTKDGPRSNRDIRVPRVQLIDAEGQNRGDVSINDALLLAEEAGLDLVEISPNAVPPVVKILDLGKLKYANQKKAAEARKNQKVIEIKEIKMRPNIDDHDYMVKMKK
eukprot:gene14088-biopygen11973